MNRILCFIAAMALCACSVKENRSGCPCELLVHPEGPLKTDGCVLVSVIQDGEVVKQGMLSGTEFEDGRCKLAISRKPTTLTVFAGITDMNTVSGKKLDITYEKQCDEVYCNSISIDPESEVFDCPVSLHKDYTCLDLTVFGMPENAEVGISGSVQGYDIVNTDPYMGLFNCFPERDDSSSRFFIRLPRQLDDGLMLDVYVGKVKWRTVPVGSMIAASGYCYDDKDLLDIKMTVNLEDSAASVKIADWAVVVYPSIEF